MKLCFIYPHSKANPAFCRLQYHTEARWGTVIILCIGNYECMYQTYFTGAKLNSGLLVAYLLKHWTAAQNAPGFQIHLQERFCSSGCTHSFLKNWVEGFPLRPSWGTLSCQSQPLREPLKLNATRNFLINHIGVLHAHQVPHSNSNIFALGRLLIAPLCTYSFPDSQQ